MRIAIASLGDPQSVQTWSGIPSHIISALKRNGHEIQPIALSRPQEPWHYNWLRRFYHRTQKKWFLGSVERQWLEPISKQLDENVNDIKPEVVLVIHGDWLAYATFKYPACIIHDTTFATIVNYYPTFMNLSKRSLRMGNQMYQRALDRSVAAVFSAEWATQSAVKEYGVPKSKVFTIPFGANIDQVPDEGGVSRLIESRAVNETCNLVFIGTQWLRKGGPDCLTFLSALHKSGIKATLSIIGCSPVLPPQMEEHVRVVGYLKKEKPSDNQIFNDILGEAHAMILLSEAECYGCVYCEANAYGLPALGRDTGGVSEIIKEGVNGLLLKPDESIESFAARWANIWKDRDRYKAVSHNSFREFKERLNYDVFVKKLEDILVPLVEHKN